MSSQRAKPRAAELSHEESAPQSGDLDLILEEIAREKTPERLLTLARKLQEALAAKKADDRTQ